MSLGIKQPFAKGYVLPEGLVLVFCGKRRWVGFRRGCLPKLTFWGYFHLGYVAERGVCGWPQGPPGHSFIIAANPEQA